MNFETIGAYLPAESRLQGRDRCSGLMSFLAIITRIAAAVEKRVEIRFVPKNTGCSRLNRIRGLFIVFKFDKLPVLFGSLALRLF